MPAIFTHRLFAESIERRLPDSLIANQEERLAFYLGNQGPDPFFYRVRATPRLGAKTRSLGHEFHSMAPAKAFGALKEGVGELPASDQTLGRAFVLGLLGHWCLDATAHPFIFAEQNALIAQDRDALSDMGAQVHAIIEAKIDTWMLWHVRRATVAAENPASDLTRTARTDAIAGALLSAAALVSLEKDLPPSEYGASVDDMQLFYRTFEPADSTQSRLLGSLECKIRHEAMPITPFMLHDLKPEDPCPWTNPNHLPWRDDRTGIASDDSFLDIYARAQTLYETLIPAFLKAKEEDFETLFPVNYSGLNRSA